MRSASTRAMIAAAFSFVESCANGFDDGGVQVISPDTGKTEPLTEESRSLPTLDDCPSSGT